MTSRGTRALAALGLVSALAAQAIAAPLPADFDSAQAAVRADLATERLWKALGEADELAGRSGLAPAQRVWSLREAARLRTRIGDVAGAERNLRDALLVSPGDRDLLLALARLLARTRPEEALRVAEQAGADELAGELKVELGDDEGARKSLAKALEGGDDLDAAAAMARVQSDKDVAADYASRAWHAAGFQPRWSRGAADRLCARLWLELGDAARAAAAFETALARDPDDLEALAALAALQPNVPAVRLEILTAQTPAPAATDELETLRRAVEQGGGREAIASADLFLEKVSDAPPWRQPEAYAAIADALLKLGPAGQERAYAAASRALALDGPRVAVALLLRRAVSTPQELDEPGSVEFAGSAFRASIDARGRLYGLEGARSAIARALRELPESKELRLESARLALRDQRPADALRELATLPAGGTPSARLARAEGYELRARAEHALKDDPAAEKSLRAAVAEAPVQREELRNVAVIEVEIGLSSAAFAHLDRMLAVSASPYERSQVWAQRSEFQRAYADSAGAEASLERALTYAPDDPALLDRLVDLEAGQGQPKALADAERLVRLSAAAGPAAAASAAARKTSVVRKLVAARTTEARDDAARGDTRAAEAALVRALALAPDDREALGSLIGFALARGERDAARTYAGRLVEASRGLGAAALSDAYASQAQTLQELGDEAGAAAALARSRALEPALREELKRSLEKNPGDWPALKRLADLELRDGGARETLSLLERHPAASGFQAPWLVWRGAARASLGDEKGARDDFAAAASRDAAAACLGSDLPERREALPLAYFDACLERLPGEPRLYVDRGMANFQAGLGGAALEDFRKAVSLAPSSPEAQLSLVSALEAGGRAPEASAAAARALRAVDAGSPLYARLLELRERLEKKAPAGESPPAR